MFRRVFLTAIASGIAAGLALSLVQTITIIPLILEAEIYESASAEQPSALATAAMAARWVTQST
jgi:predicted cobalt transporter CbtA